MIISTPLEERLIRFPNLFLQSYEFRALGRFDKAEFFRSLLGSYWLTNVPASYTLEDRADPPERAHGPFDPQKLSASDYLEVAAADVVKSIRGQVDTAPTAPDDEWNTKTFPDPPASGQRLDALLDAVVATEPACFRLEPSILEAGDDRFADQFSRFHKEVGGPLWHFEEWVTCSPASGTAYMLILGYD